MSENKNDDNNAIQSDDSNNGSSKITSELLLKEIRDRDIRVILCGNIHNNVDTALPIPLLDTLKGNITEIYIEEAIEWPAPGPAILDEQKNDLTEKQPGETQRFRDILKIIASSPIEMNMARPEIQYLVKNDLIDRAFAFGCEKHKYTRDTLTSAITKVKKNEIIIISIGEGHFFRSSDPTRSQNVKLSRPISGNPLDQKAELSEVDPENVGAATIFSSNSSTELYTSSLALVDHLAGVGDFGMLTIIGGWSVNKVGLHELSHLEYKLGLNLAVSELMKRLQNNEKMMIAKNFLEWDKDYFMDMLEGKNKSYFDRFQDFLRDHLVAEIYQNLNFQLADWDSYFQEQCGPADAASLLIAPMQLIVPGAKSPIELEKQIQLLRNAELINRTDFDIEHQDYGSDFD
jgi:hypothetical protein